MFTIFNLLELWGLVWGCLIGGNFGFTHWGVLGAGIGAPIGGYLGLVIGRIPFFVGLRYLKRRLARKSVDHLRSELHNSGCSVPNCVLLELQSRGEDIQRELPF